jgi:predicted HAD superfamily Cof-like phosphohydrolase
MTSDYVKDIDDFHKKFGLAPRISGAVPSKELLEFRVGFLMEELSELNLSLSKTPIDIEGTLDALVDLVYVALGTAWLLNLPFDAAWKRVHEANMKKVRATDPSASKRGTSMDVVKPIGWVAPTFTDLLDEYDRRAFSPQLDLDDVVKQNKGDI